MHDDLIRKLEEADEGSRALDGETWCAKNNAEFVQWDGAGCVYRAADSGAVGIRHRPAEHIPRYSESLDAALSLLPEDWWLMSMGEGRSPIIYKGDTHEPSGSFWAKVQHVRGGRAQIAQARTLVLALTAACLKARAATNPASDEM
jgi:hypothetical protein